MKTEMIPAPLFRDPIFDGASDPVVIRSDEDQCWYMFYTQRRAASVQVGFSSIHGSDIGIASSADGLHWLYRGIVPGLAIEPGHNTFWAPEIIRVNGKYHMYVSYITGIPTTWDYPRKILHYTAETIWKWKYEGAIELSSDRVIDACIYEIQKGCWKMWYKDENHNSFSYAAISTDLYHWEVLGPEVTDCPHEGPNVFELGGKKWMITDFWNGLAVYASDDFTHWTRQEEPILAQPGHRKTDETLGHHADVVVNGDEAIIYYFCHPYQREASPRSMLTAIQAAVLTVQNGKLVCDR